MPAIDPTNLPAIPLWVRQWIYLLYLLALLTANSVDAFYDQTDPWWLPGALRVLNVVGLFVTAVALVNARPTPAEQRADVVKDARKRFEEQQESGPTLLAGEISHPDNLYPPPVTRRDDAV